jgi:hypothetical protein
MSVPTTAYRGVVHGNIIALAENPGLPDGQEVSVSMQPVESISEQEAQAGLLRAFGAWADDPAGLDEYLEWNRQQRKIGRREIEQ